MSDADKKPEAPEIDETLPEVVKGFLRRGYQLEDIHLDARGRWFHEGEPFENPKLIALFSRSVGRTTGGTWVLEVGPYTYPIRVEDAGFFVERIEFSSGAGAAPTLYLSDETTETLDLSTLSYEPEGRLYCRVKGGDFRARFQRPAYYALAQHFVERDGQVFVDLGDASYPLG